MAKKGRRPYRKAKRAEAEEETRRRITEAAMALHGTVGPASTTLTEVAKRAGVSRMTVYNHFPTELDLFVACSSHWTHRNPFPDPEAWRRLPDPHARLAQAVIDLYGWYDRNQGMLENVLRDTPLLPSLQPLVAAWWGGYMDRVVAVLAEGWGGGGERHATIGAGIRLAIDFHSWRVLTGAKLTHEGAARLFARMISAIDAET